VIWASHRARGGGALGLAIVGAWSLVLPTPGFAASSSPIGPETLSVILDIRAVAADGEPSWTDGGFGKTRFGGDQGDPAATPVLAEAALIWQPELRWDLRGTVAVAAQHEQDQPVDLIEAFLAYKPVPRGSTRTSARAGLYWPAVSLEHEGASWTVADMITPSAINSWIGEEVKIVGAEVTATRDVGGNRLAATLGLFGFNDTAGTLIAFRGWALHDVKATAFGHQRLPGLNGFMQMAQAPTTKPLIELDGRPGYYAKLSWQARAPVRLEAFYYDNRGDPTAVDDGLQWGWNTRFLNLGLRVDLSDETRLLAQALTGTTEMGFPDAQGRYWVETKYRAAYSRLTHERGRLALSGRIDLFDTDEAGSEMSPGEGEKGWALAAAAAWSLSPEATLLAEALHVASDRPVRSRQGIDARQAQTLVQVALRLIL
jgi:hypothetical protein